MAEGNHISGDSLQLKPENGHWIYESTNAYMLEENLCTVDLPSILFFIFVK